MQNGFGTLQESQLLLAKLTFTLALFLIKSGEWESWLKVIWNNHSHCTVVNPMSLIQHGQIMPHHAFPRHLREMWFHKWLASHLEAKTSDSLPKSSPKVSITITLMSINPLEPHSSGTLFNMVFKQNMVTGSFIEVPCSTPTLSIALHLSAFYHSPLSDTTLCINLYIFLFIAIFPCV